MKRNLMKWLIALASAVAFWLALLQSGLHAQGSDALVMVANKSNSAAAGSSLADARKLLLGETASWKNGTKVVVVLGPPGSADRTAILKKVCGMTEAAYTRFGMQASFTGQSAANVEVAGSEAAIKSAVKSNPGAIGFLHKNQVDATVQSLLELP